MARKMLIDRENSHYFPCQGTCAETMHRARQGSVFQVTFLLTAEVRSCTWKGRRREKREKKTRGSANTKEGTVLINRKRADVKPASAGQSQEAAREHGVSRPSHLP